MRIRWPFATILVLLFLWQMALILRAVLDLLRGIDARSMSEYAQLNESDRRIPSIIHQTWKTNDLSSYPIQNSHANWTVMYSDFEIRLWTDAQIDELIANDAYRYLSDVYHSYRYAIQRADLARLIILHRHGGIYADLDVYPYQRSLDNLLLKNVSFIIARSSSDGCVMNHFMISERQSPIVEKILRRATRKAWFEQIYVLPYLEVFSTGSIFLMSVLRDCAKRDGLLVLSRDELAEHVFHDAGRSWHLLDGYLLNQVDAHPRRFLFLLVVFFLLCAWKFCKFSRRRKRV